MEDSLEAQVRDGLVQVSFAVTAVLSQVAAAHELSLTQLRMFGVLRDREITMAELAGSLGLDRSSVTGLVDRASRRGWVQRRQGVADRRQVLVSLTDEGRQLAALGAAEVGSLLRPLVGLLSVAERESLARLLGALADAR
jgi:DNA-binding MarR family transcriptional regulator